MISVEEAKDRLSELVSRAAAGERVTIGQRERPMAVLIGAAELDSLERSSRTARRLALALGQSPELLRQIELGESHPIMAAFGLWKEEADLGNLTEEIYAHRRQSSRPEVVLGSRGQP